MYNPAVFDICSKLAQRYVTSPDFPKLRMCSHHLWFNYMPKFRPGREWANSLLDHGRSVYLGKAHTATDRWLVQDTFSKTGFIDDAERVAFRNDVPHPPGNFSPLFRSQIKGDLYALTPEAILNVDRVIGNDSKYIRQETFVYAREQIAPFKRDTIRNSVKCFIYVGDEEYWEAFQLKKCNTIKDDVTNNWMWN